MVKILLFIGAEEGELLLKKILENYLNIGEFHIIYEDETLRNNIPKKENIFFYKINFYAYELYKSIIDKQFDKVFIFIKNQKAADFVLRKFKFHNVALTFVKFWYKYKLPDINLSIEIIDVADIITNKIIDLIPNVVLYARDIGLGEGEILELEVPIGSPYQYSPLKSVETKFNVKVAAVYRNNRLRNVKNLNPRDKIILIGEPKNVKQAFEAIKFQRGIFPQPYGQHIYLLLDMKIFNQHQISHLLKTALFLHRKLKNKKLIIRIINPNTKHKIYKLYKFPDIDIISDFYETSYIKMLKKDTNHFNIGLIITPYQLFFKYTKEFFNIKIPILKTGKESIKRCNKVSTILHKETFFIINTLFDISTQLGIDVNILNFNSENEEIKLRIEELIKKMNIKGEITDIINENPIYFLEKNDNYCLIENFKKAPPSKMSMILNPKDEYSYIFLNKINQFLIPTKKEENES